MMSRLRTALETVRGAVPSRADELGRRRRWLTPASAALLGVALGFAGFYLGVRDERSQTAGAGSARSAPRAPSARSASSRSSSGTRLGAPALGSSSGLTAGTVTSIDGDTVYVREISGATIKVRLISTSTIKKTLRVSSGAIRPGDSVTIGGSPGKDATISSTSIDDSGGSTTTTASASASASTEASSLAAGG
jgi:hypothetical protein